MDESDDIRRIKQRDWHGLEALIERYQLRAVRAAYLVIGDQAEAEDVVVEAFYRVWRQIDQFDNTRPFAPWFFTLVLNAARHVVGRSARFIDLPEEDPEDTTFSDQTISSPEDEIIQAESEEAFHPGGLQKTLDLGRGVFAVLRTSPDGSQSILCLQNITPQTQVVVHINKVYNLEPYQTLWQGYP